MSPDAMIGSILGCCCSRWYPPYLRTALEEKLVSTLDHHPSEYFPQKSRPGMGTLAKTNK